MVESLGFKIYVVYSREFLSGTIPTLKEYYRRTDEGVILSDMASSCFVFLF